jgi:hypothetical protein
MVHTVDETCFLFLRNCHHYHVNYCQSLDLSCTCEIKMLLFAGYRTTLYIKPVFQHIRLCSFYKHYYHSYLMAHTTARYIFHECLSKIEYRKFHSNLPQLPGIPNIVLYDGNLQLLLELKICQHEDGGG